MAFFPDNRSTLFFRLSARSELAFDISSLQMVAFDFLRIG
jgi:hypothetical protein